MFANIMRRCAKVIERWELGYVTWIKSNDSLHMIPAADRILYRRSISKFL